MKTTRILVIAGGVVAAIFLQYAPVRLGAQASAALSGRVTSAEEGPMEGVVVSAKKDGSPISISVVTGAGGRFAFPAARLEPGHYTLKVRRISGRRHRHVRSQDRAHEGVESTDAMERAL